MNLQDLFWQKKNKGFTIYEIEMEEDINKINDSIKKQKVEINKKPIEIVFASKKDMKKDNDFKNKKGDTLIQSMKNKTMEREILSNKKGKINDEIKNLQNRIQIQKQELRNAENENDYIRKEIEKKSNLKQTNKANLPADSKKEIGLKVKIKEENEQSNQNTNPIEKLESKNTIEERANRAMARFKKAYSINKGKEEENKGQAPPGNSHKIQTLAAILQEHIIKPLAEIAQEPNLRPRGGSVEVRNKHQGIAELLENAPIQKNVKKPKKLNFE